jgi:hypothetical protein
VKRRVTTIRADVGLHCLSAGALAGSPVGKLSNDQLTDAKAQIQHEVNRMIPLKDDAALERLWRDLKAIAEEIGRREVCL